MTGGAIDSCRPETVVVWVVSAAGATGIAFCAKARAKQPAIIAITIQLILCLRSFIVRYLSVIL
jgi:hypothetical protein